MKRVGGAYTAPGHVTSVENLTGRSVHVNVAASYYVNKKKET